jgi:hypothetical protein
MRNISNKTILTALVNYKCKGYFGKCVAHLNSKERNFVIDELIRRGYIDNKMKLTELSHDIVLDNLNLLQY